MNKGLFFLLLIFLVSCSETEKKDQLTNTGLRIQGETQGTTYTITYIGDTTNYKTSVDSLLGAFDKDLSLWDKNSLICQVNNHQRRDSVFSFVDSSHFFSVVFDMSRGIYEKTYGAFDPSIYPYIEAWGFGLKNKSKITEGLLDSLSQEVGFDELSIDKIEHNRDTYIYDHTEIWKGNPNVRLDFNAIAQGYSVDVIGSFLEDQGIVNYMVEIGGEVLCKGVNQNNQTWSIAIDSPESEIGNRDYQAIVHLKNKAIATSGSYRSFYIEDGIKYSHTIDPKTGRPVTHSLLSVSVVADDCASADAYATAFMVMGTEGIEEFLIDHQDLGLEVYLISDINGQLHTGMSPGMSEILEEINSDSNEGQTSP